MYGYIFETTNKQTGETYLGKIYSVAFNKNFLGDSEELAKAIEKYGRTSFEVRMIMPYESPEQLDAAFEEMQAERKPKPKKKVEEPKAEKKVEEPKEEPVEEKPVKKKSTRTKQVDK